MFDVEADEDVLVDGFLAMILDLALQFAGTASVDWQQTSAFCCFFLKRGVVFLVRCRKAWHIHERNMNQNSINHVDIMNFKQIRAWYWQTLSYLS